MATAAPAQMEGDLDHIDEGEGEIVTVRQKTETKRTEFTVLEETQDDPFKYEPPKKDDTLPDLYRLLETLDDNKGDLDTEKQPPSLFSRPEHVTSYKKISELKLQLEEEELHPYLDHFEQGVKDEVVMLGSISLDDVQEEEKHLRDEHIQYLEQEANEARERQQRLLKAEEEAKKRVAFYTKQRREEIARREEILLQKERLLMERLHMSFRRAESQLTSILERRKGEVKTFYGDLMMTEGQYGGSRGRRWKVDWNQTPQPIQIKMKCLRGVKDKLPRGRYVLMVSLYDRLGGNILRWSKMKGQHWGGATLPIHHDGQFYNVEMKLDQSMFTVLPSKMSLKPGMVLVFELYLLRGAVVTTDRVVGWGCFPICDAQFDVIEGKYKVPFLRGEVDSLIEKHSTVEELVSRELDHWLCNMYFEVIKLPRYLAGMKEFEVELDFSSALTAYPDRRRTGGEEYRDGEKPLLGSMSDLSTSNDGMGSQSSLESALPAYNLTTRTTATVSKVNLEDLDKATMYSSRKMHKDRKVDLAMLDRSSESEDSETEDVKAIKGEEEYRRVRRMPGMYYKTYKKNPVDAYQDKLFSVLPKTAITEPRHVQKKLTHIEELEQHSYAVQPVLAGLGQVAKHGHERMSYVGRQFLAELGLSQWRGREFWTMLLILIVTFYIRMYVHYLGQWAFLSAIEIPINQFNFLPYTVELNYQYTLLTTMQEIAVVVFGPLINLMLFSLLVSLCWVCQRLIGEFPDFGCKFIMAYGINTILDPVSILIIDCTLGRYEDNPDIPMADFVKLWWHFYNIEGSGLAGAFITSFLYLFFAFMAGAILYMYFLRLHNNGRLIDVYWRLHGRENMFFIPYDLELSNQELNYIINKAEAWRGDEGERRKVAVYDYVWEEEDMDDSIWNEETVDDDGKKRENRKEITTHVSIHVIHLDGLRELHRQFLRLPDGAVVELFGDMAVPGMDKDIKNAMEQGTKNLEKLKMMDPMGSRSSIRVRGRETVMTRNGFRGDERPTSSASSSGASSIPFKKKMS